MRGDRLLLCFTAEMQSTMSTQKTYVGTEPTGTRTPSEEDILKYAPVVAKKVPAGVVPLTAPELASRETQRTEAALGDAVLRFLRIRKRPKDDRYDLDAVSPQFVLFQGGRRN